MDSIAQNTSPAYALIESLKLFSTFCKKHLNPDGIRPGSISLSGLLKAEKTLKNLFVPV